MAICLYFVLDNKMQSLCVDTSEISIIFNILKYLWIPIALGIEVSIEISNCNNNVNNNFALKFHIVATHLLFIEYLLFKYIPQPSDLFSLRT